MEIKKKVDSIKEYYKTNETKDYLFRINALRSLKRVIKENEEQINSALLNDLNKSKYESYLCELGLIYEEINYTLRNLKKWMKNQRVRTPLAQFPSKSFISPEPYGVVLIMAPWNYPIQLCLCPLIGAIAGGNCAVIKPSAYAPNCSAVIKKLINEAFPSHYVDVVEGSREQNQELLMQKFDYIFFTGSVSVGKVVMEAASKNLTPVSLELGGKSPVIVDESCDLYLASKRIAFGKILNAGQTCVAPDYVFVNRKIKDEFVKYYIEAIEKFFPNGSYNDFPHIINEKHFNRLKRLLNDENVLFGGNTEEKNLFIEPTLLDSITLQSKIMQEEIFGPILPLIEYDDISECIEYIASKPKPLALYLFSNNKKTINEILRSCSFGGGCINDTIIHLATSNMGFGGVGDSGIGSYHGKKSFDTFTHYRSIVHKRFWLDIKVRYRPYTDKKDKIIRKLMK